MPRSTITIDDLPAALVELARLDREAVVGAMRDTAELLKSEAIRQMEGSSPYPPVDTGELKRSYRVFETPDGAILENVAPHAGHMEYGTRPGHMPPLQPLLKWARRKLRGGSIRVRTAKGWRDSSEAEREDEALAMAEGTRRMIYRFGLQPRRFHARAMEKAPQLLEWAVKRRLKGVLGKWANR